MCFKKFDADLLCKSSWRCVLCKSSWRCECFSIVWCRRGVLCGITHQHLYLGKDTNVDEWCVELCRAFPLDIRTFQKLMKNAFRHPFVYFQLLFACVPSSLSEKMCVCFEGACWWLRPNEKQHALNKSLIFTDAYMWRKTFPSHYSSKSRSLSCAR